RPDCGSAGHARTDERGGGHMRPGWPAVHATERNFGGAQKGLPITRDEGCARDCAVPRAAASCSHETGCRMIAALGAGVTRAALYRGRVRAALTTDEAMKVREARDRLSEVLDAGADLIEE